MSIFREQLQDILLCLSWREFARTYFGKSASWLYHKLDGIGAEITEQEKEQFRASLRNLAERINTVADNIK